MQGIIIKGYSSFYYVETPAGLYECSLRGKHRTKKQDFYPGDRVIISPLENEEKKKGVIEAVLDRTTFLKRPPVANVSLLVLVLSLSYPAADKVLLDRLLVLAQSAGIWPLVLLNKLDEAKDGVEASLRAHLKASGYPVISASSKSGQGLEALSEALEGQTTVFAGQSGVGKSSLMNQLVPKLSLQTGVLGDKSRRGKHTTRHVELFSFKGGYIVDSPGFSRLYLPDIPKEELHYCFPEFAPYIGSCRFNSCLHDKEPGCAVKKALENQLISAGRYQHYLDFLHDLQTKEKEYYD